MTVLCISVPTLAAFGSFFFILYEFDDFVVCFFPPTSPYSPLLFYFWWLLCYIYTRLESSIWCVHTKRINIGYDNLSNNFEKCLHIAHAIFIRLALCTLWWVVNKNGDRAYLCDSCAELHMLVPVYLIYKQQPKTNVHKQILSSFILCVHTLCQISATVRTKRVETKPFFIHKMSCYILL